LNLLVKFTGQKEMAQKMENKHLVSPSQQCSSTPVSFVQGFLGKEYVTTQDHPPYYPDLAPADFYLFPPVKLSVKGQCFCNAKDIMKTATEEL
jgi:hypothetical protein